jgi:hypothetical protein
MISADRACAAFGFASVFLAPLASAAPNGVGPRDDGGDEHASTVVALDWRHGPGAESCIDGATLAREVEGRLERHVFGNAMEADVFLRGQVERRESDFQVRLSMVAANGRFLGERELHTESSDCTRLDESLAIVIALALDSLRAIPVASFRVPKTVPREGWGAKVGPTAVGSLGLLPSVGVSVGFEIILQPPGLWPLDFVWGISPFPTRADVAGRGADFSALQLGGFLCPLTYTSRFEARACLGAEFDYLRAMGFALNNERSPGSAVVGPAVHSGLFFPLGTMLGLSTNFTLAVPLLRDRFTYKVEGGGDEVLHQPSAIVLFLGIGLLLRIP